jgi:hypothetical protein
MTPHLPTEATSGDYRWLRLVYRELTPIYDRFGDGGRRSGPFHGVSRRTYLSGSHHRCMKGQAGSYGDS